MGAGISVITVVTIAYFAAKGVKSAASGHKHTVDRIIDSVVLVLIVFLIVRTFLTRKTSKPPKWMSKLLTAEPKFSLVVGLVLFGVFPPDLIGSITAGFHLARHDAPWWQCLPFVGLTLLLLALPALCVVILGRRAGAVLPKIRNRMNQNAWVVNEIVLVFFSALVIKSLVKG